MYVWKKMMKYKFVDFNKSIVNLYSNINLDEFEKKMMKYK